ncbi:MAG: hypothetical protein FWJ83_08845, partial [Limnochordales bacterium]
SVPAVAQHRMVFYGALLVLAMIVRPNGLLGTSSEQGWLEMWLARRKAKHAARGPARLEAAAPGQDGADGRSGE